MKEVSDSLAGRCALLDMEPFSVDELGNDFWQAKSELGLASILTRGLYPQLWAEPSMPRSDFYRSYLGTYIERDVRQILNITSVRDFDRFMRVCAVRSGQLVNKSEIAKEVGVSPKTINDWLSILHASNQVVLLEPYFENISKRVVKSPKLYFTDTGLVTFLMGLDQSTILSSPFLGNIWETFVFAELRKTLFLERPEASLWFYRDQQKEADFIISYGSKIYLLDAKWKEVPTRREFATVNSIQKLFKRAYEKTYLISTNEKSFPLSVNEQVISGFSIKDFVIQL
jgi:predicted AAA+ superfamily ATPase